MNKLSVAECHIYIEQGLQREASHRKDFQFRPAVDIALNIAQNRILRSRLKPDKDNPERFEINQPFASDIQPLIVRDYELSVYTKANQSKSYGVLPYDFGYLLSSKSYVIEKCDSGFDTPTLSIDEKIITIPFTSNASGAPYYTAIIVAYNSNNITINTDGFDSKLEKTYMVDSVLAAFKTLGTTTVYWENYKDIYQPESFIVVSRDPATTAGLTVDTSTMTPSTSSPSIVTYKTTLLGTQHTNRDLKADFIDSSEYNSKYHKSIPRSPVAYLSENHLIVEGEDKRFLANRMLITYIRKPKRINLTLGQGPELHPTIHEGICDVAVQVIKKRLEDETYPVEVQDNKGRIE